MFELWEVVEGEKDSHSKWWQLVAPTGDPTTSTNLHVPLPNPREARADAHDKLRH